MYDHIMDINYSVLPYAAVTTGNIFPYWYSFDLAWQLDVMGSEVGARLGCNNLTKY
jgi:hypothetical protein